MDKSNGGFQVYTGPMRSMDPGQKVGKRMGKRGKTIGALAGFG